MKELEGYIYLCKYSDSEPYVTYKGDRKLLVTMLINAINSNELFFEAIDYCAKQNGYGMEGK